MKLGTQKDIRYESRLITNAVRRERKMGHVRREVGDYGLCGSCSNAHIDEDESGRVRISCDDLPTHQDMIMKKVTRCNRYQAANMPSKYDMQRMAWIIVVDSEKKIGFVQPGTEKHRKILYHTTED